MSSHRHRQHQTIRISILLGPNWFTPRVLTVCSVCFKIYAVDTGRLKHVSVHVPCEMFITDALRTGVWG